MQNAYQKNVVYFLPNQILSEHGGLWTNLTPALILKAVDIEKIVFLSDCDDQEVDEADWRDDGVHDAEHQAQQDCDGVLGHLRSSQHPYMLVTQQFL